MNSLRILLAAFSLVFALYSSSESASPGEQWEKLVAAANKEGKVVIYGRGAAEYVKVYRDHFQKSFPGIKVNYVGGRSDLAHRLTAERRAGKYFPDLFLMSGGRLVRGLRAQGAFQSLRSALVLPEVKDTSKWFEGKHWFADKEEKYLLMFAMATSTNIAVNTDLVDPKKLTWRGKIVSRDIRGSGPGSGNVKYLYVNKQLGPSFLKKLYGEMDITFSRNMRQMIDWLARGRYAILVFPTLRDIDRAREQGLPVEIVNPKQMKEGYGVTSGGRQALMMNPAPHPNAAKVFMNWLLSREGQTAVEKVIGYPSLRIDTPTKKDLREFTVPKQGADYMVVSLEKYWYLDREVQSLVKSAAK
jgi:iron(III) transport system substrate-binding protein